MAHAGLAMLQNQKPIRTSWRKSRVWNSRRQSGEETRGLFGNTHSSIAFSPMIGENRQLVINEPVEFAK